MPKQFLTADQKIDNYSTLQLIRDTYHYIRPYRRYFFIGSAMRLTGDIINLYPTYSLALIVNYLTTGNINENLSKVWTVVGILLLTYVANIILRHFAKIYVLNVGNKIEVDVQQLSIAHLFKLDIAWHEKENTGNKLKRIQTASQGFKRLMHVWINNVIEILVNFVGIVVIVYQFDKTIALFTIIFLIVYFIVNKILLKKVAMASNNVNIANEEVSGLQFEALNNIRTVKIMSMIKTLREKLKFNIDKLYSLAKINIFWFMNRQSGSHLLGFIFKAVVLIFIIYGIIQGHYEVGLLVLYNGYFNRVWESVDELSNVSEDILIARYSISRLNTIMNEPVQIDDEVNKKPFPKNWKSIKLVNISFSYGNNEVLRNINFEIMRGERIGIVGLSGAGKSTLFKLLLKEYENFSGEILIDGVPIQEISKQDYFKYVAVVLQDTEVFNFSLRENVYIASPGSKNKDVELNKALEIAHVNDFLPKLPDGIDTEIGEKGVRLSGGEKQRLGIARAVFKQPQLLLLDEATSHLDLESEEKIQDSLHQFFRNVTAVVIAHRLTTIKEMDKIIVIEDGEIIESGNFAELTAKQGRFYELWEKQRL